MKLSSWCFPMVILFAFPGCMLVETTQEAWRQSARQFRFRDSDYRDTAEEVNDEWDFVGDEARPIHGVEKDPDQWYKRWFMSEKARSIERNLGID